MNVDGWLTIGTRIDNKKLQSDLKKQKQELEKYGKEAEELLSLKEKYEADVQAYETEQKHLQETKKEYDEINKRVKELAKERSRISDLTESEMKQAYAERPELSTGYFELLEKRSALNKELLRGTTTNNAEIEQEKQALADINQRLDENLSKQHAIGQNIENITTQLERGQISNSIKDIGNSLSKVVKKVSRWALAVFGLRSAYMAVRNAINVISQGDEQLKADIDYIKNVFAYALEPVVRKIVDLAKQLLYYLGYLIKIWTNYDIFANANKNLKKSVGSAKELKKQLAGFDEMNILSDSSSGGGGVSANTMSLDDFAPPKWFQVVAKVGKTLGPVLAGLFAMLFKMKKLGILIALKGIYDTIKNIIDFIQDPNFKSFMGILEGIAEIVIGIGVAIGSWPVLIGGVIALIILKLAQNIGKVEEFFDNLIDWMDKHVLTWLVDHFGVVGIFIYEAIKTAVEWIKDTFVGVLEGVQKIADGIVKIFKGDVWGGLKDIFGGLLDILLAPFKTWYNTTKHYILDLLDWMGILNRKKALGGGGTGSLGGGGSMGGRAKGGIFYPSKLPRLAVGGIINQPGSGVGYHGAYIGERGAEAVVPLTDSQQMALLGETIGRYVNIKADIPVYVGNRMVARELKRINAEDDFAYNR